MTLTFLKADKAYWSKLAEIAIPVSIQCSLFSVLAVVDTFMVNQLGEAQTAAVGVGGRLFFFNLMVISSISSALGVLASQYYGAKSSDGVQRTLTQSWGFSMLTATPFVLVYFFWPTEVVAIFADAADFQGYAGDYLLYTSVSLWCTALVVPLESAMRAVGYAKVPTKVGLWSIVVNVIINALLIFGLFGFPELGIIGAAIGTTISRIFQTLLLFYFARKDLPHILPQGHHWRAGLEKAHLKRYFDLALPMFVQGSAWSGGLLIYAYLFGQMGVTELAIMSLLSPIESTLLSLFMGFAVGASVILGNEIGAENYSRVEQSAHWYAATACSFALLIALSVWAASPWIGELLEASAIQDPAMALNVCLILAFTMTIRVFNMVTLGGVLKSGGDVKYTIFIDVFGLWAVGLPLTYCMGIVLGWPLHYALLGLAGEDIVKALLAVHRVNSKKWIRNLIKDEETVTA